MKTIVVLSGAGMSAESGISTFRDSNGLWEQHRIEDVATYEAWVKNKQLVIDFYNQRRKQLYEVEPNAAHYALAKLEKHFNVKIVTQNVDDLHERAGSTQVLHLHGELKKVRSTINPNLVYNLDGWELKAGDLCELGSQLRPHIVWFGEDVPLIHDAEMMVSSADIFIVIGTSLNVYPAAGLVHYAKPSIPKFICDPHALSLPGVSNLKVLSSKAGDAIPNLVDNLMSGIF